MHIGQGAQKVRFPSVGDVFASLQRYGRLLCGNTEYQNLQSLRSAKLTQESGRVLRDSQQDLTAISRVQLLQGDRLVGSSQMDKLQACSVRDGQKGGKQPPLGDFDAIDDPDLAQTIS